MQSGMNETITNGTNYKLPILDLGKDAVGKMHFSILAKESAQFIFFQENVGSGFILSIDGWGVSHRSNIRYCGNIPSTKGAEDCKLLGVRFCRRNFNILFEIYKL
jgi:hypothetical protein